MVERCGMLWILDWCVPSSRRAVVVGPSFAPRSTVKRLKFHVIVFVYVWLFGGRGWGTTNGRITYWANDININAISFNTYDDRRQRRTLLCIVFIIIIIPYMNHDDGFLLSLFILAALCCVCVCVCGCLCELLCMSACGRDVKLFASLQNCIFHLHSLK